MKRYVLAAALIIASSVGEAQRLSHSVALDGSPQVRRFPDPGEIVIELAAMPLLARETNTAAASAELDALLQRLERDLAIIGSDIAAKSAHGLPRIRHRYTMAFAGASARVDPEAVERIRRLEYVKRVHPDRYVTALLHESVAQVGATDAWREYGVRGEGVVVAVIDTGIDYRHPAFGGGFGPGHKVRGGRDFVNNDNDPMDDHGHGTHVAGIVAADGGGLLGVAPDAELLAYKVLDASGSGRDSWVLAAIEEVARQRPDIVNMSLGRPAGGDDPVVRALENASAAGILFCVSAGNSGRFLDIGSPAVAPSAIAVGAVDNQGRLAPFSSKGPLLPTGSIKPEVVAPGVAILSAAPGGGTRTASGTSMAAPHVAGVAALLRSIHRQWSSETIRSALISGTRPVDAEVMAAGAGSVHALDAAASVVFPSSNLLSFGISDQSQSSWTATRALTLTNRSSQPQSLSLDIGGLQEGIDVRPSAISLSVQPGESARVDLEIEVDHSKVPAPEFGSLSFGGLLRFAGDSSSFSVPWSFVRASKIRVIWTGTEVARVKLGTARMMVEGWTDPAIPVAELFIGAGQVSLWLDSGVWDGPVARHVILENLDLSSTSELRITPDDAPHRISFQGADLSGRPLSDRGERYLREIAFRHPHFESRLLDIVTNVPRNQELFVSSLSERVRLFAFERAFDLDPLVTWVAQYPPVTAVDGDVEVKVDPGDWKLLAVSAAIPSDLEQPYQHVWAAVRLFTPSGSLTGVARPNFDGSAPEPGVETRAYVTPSQSDDSATSIMIEIGERSAGEGATPPPPSLDFLAEFTGDESGTVPGNGQRRRPSDHVIPSGEPIVLGDGPAYPKSAVMGVENKMLARVQWLGPLKEDRVYDVKRMTADLYDTDGRLVASGKPPPRYSPAPPPGIPTLYQMLVDLPAAGAYTLKAVNSSFAVAGLPAQATLTANFDSTRAEAAAPTLTSLRISDGTGRTTSSLPKRSASTMTFSAVDLSIRGFEAVLTEKTMVEYRRHGGSGGIEYPWLSITAVELGDDLAGPFREFDGTLYQADLSSVTTTMRGAVDVRISVEDAAGNSTVYVLEPAFVVQGGKRRAVSQP